MMIDNINMTKVLMDGGSGINILYKDAFNGLTIDPSKLHPSMAPFHGVVLGQRMMPLGTIILIVTISGAVNYCKEMLTIEVVDFSETYHAILVRPYMLHHVHGYPKLCLPQAQDFRPAWHHHDDRKLRPKYLRV